MKRFIASVLVFASLLGCLCGCSSSRSKTPWGKLGVSESEYKKVYNHIKYGT